MISDVLHQALRDIGAYLDDRPSLYQGEDRAMVVKLTDHMNEVLKHFDMPPSLSAEPNANVKTP